MPDWNLRFSAEFLVNDIEKITWNSSAFDSLMIPPERKEIIQSLVERYTKGSKHLTNKPFYNIIRGKSESVVILLQYNSSLNSALSSTADCYFLVVFLELEKLW